MSRKFQDPAIREQWRQIGHELKEEHEGVIFRTSSINATREDVQNELISLRKQYEEIVGVARSLKKPGVVYESHYFLKELREELKKMHGCRLIIDDTSLKEKLLHQSEQASYEIILHQEKRNIFSAYGIDEAVEKAMKRVVWLSNGSYLVIDETEALTIIDVNTGKFSGKNDLQDTVVRTNELAAEEIARQLKLRDIGGIILIDFIDMKEAADQVSVQKKLERAVQRDKKRTNIIGFTPLGIMQLTRKKTKIALTEGLTEKCKTCDGTGRVPSSETIAFKLERELWELRGSDYEHVTVETTEDVKNVFCGVDGIHLRRIEDLLNNKLHFQIRESEKPFYKIVKLI